MAMQSDNMAADEFAIFAAAFAVELQSSRDANKAYFFGLYAKEMYIQQDVEHAYLQEQSRKAAKKRRR